MELFAKVSIKGLSFLSAYDFSRLKKNMSTMSLNETAEQSVTSSANSDFQSWNLKPYIGPSIMITVFGTVTNLLSLSYFITQRNFNNRKSRTEVINNHLFIVLNVFDILVCIFLSATLLEGTYSTYGENVYNGLLLVFIVAVQTTGFITCLLSVIRAISIIRPRHHLNVHHAYLQRYDDIPKHTVSLERFNGH